MANMNHNNNNRKKENAHHNHYNRFRGGRNRHKDNYENKDVVEEVDVRENHREGRERRDNREYRENKENRNNKDNQAIHTFTLGTKELEGKNAEFQYDKGWYSIIDIVGEEKNVIYKSKNAQEAYTKWNVYIGRKKERAPKAE